MVNCTVEIIFPRNLVGHHIVVHFIVAHLLIFIIVGFSAKPSVWLHFIYFIGIIVSVRYIILISREWTPCIFLNWCFSIVFLLTKNTWSFFLADMALICILDWIVYNFDFVKQLIFLIRLSLLSRNSLWIYVMVDVIINRCRRLFKSMTFRWNFWKSLLYYWWLWNWFSSTTLFEIVYILLKLWCSLVLPIT